MPFRRRIARRAPVLAAQQGKRRFTVFPNAAALPVNPFQHSACNVQRVRPIRLLRQVVCRQFRAAEQFTNALFILPFQRVFHLLKRFAKLHQPLRQGFSPFLHMRMKYSRISCALPTVSKKNSRFAAFGG